MHVNQAGIDLIKSFEQCRLEAYKDPVGIVTLGWGATGPDIKLGMTWSQAQCDARLGQDLDAFEKGVASLLGPLNVTSNEFSALVCFAYNVGLGNLKASLLLRCLQKGNHKDAAEQFTRWNKAGGRELLGLTRRRQAERQLFLT